MEIIAEIGQNHNGDMDTARELIRQAAANGASAAKFQVYDAARLFPKEGNPWYDYNLSTELSRDQVNMLADECRRLKIEFLASAFDPERVSWLEEIGVTRHKIASRSIADQDLLDAVIATGKRIIVSLGHWKSADLPAISAPGGIDFLHCVSLYPAPLSAMKLSEIDFDRYAGLSDHSLGAIAAITAMARGAQIIEKHFTMNKTWHGPDHSCSMVPDELAAICHARDEIAEVVWGGTSHD